MIPSLLIILLAVEKRKLKMIAEEAGSSFLGG
uniref:Uncharacterized protein n=1 Tax=Anopheles minimus TaxID=112268 RepID=A0A182WMY7_9DIPT